MDEGRRPCPNNMVSTYTCLIRPNDNLYDIFIYLPSFPSVSMCYTLRRSSYFFFFYAHSSFKSGVLKLLSSVLLFMLVLSYAPAIRFVVYRVTAVIDKAYTNFNCTRRVLQKKKSLLTMIRFSSMRYKFHFCVFFTKKKKQ